jgi:hypothetical protein
MLMKESSEGEKPEVSELPLDLRNVISELLYHSQMLEYLLRAYLSDLNEAADEWARQNRFRFRTRSDTLKRETLGRLVNLYALHSDVEWLVRDLKAFVSIRNSVAHTAFVWAFVHRDKDDSVAEAITRVNEHIATARKLVHAMTLESVRAYELKTRSASIGAPPSEPR